MTDPQWDWDRFRRSVAAPARVDPGIGDTLGRYRLIRKIARGAAGAVYEAEDMELQRTVAVKILHEVANLSDVARQRFQREAKSAARLAHPNIVRIHDTGEENGRPYLVMELVDGQPLSEILGRREVELRRLLALLEKVARAVGSAHDAGIIHRDLKPANIMVDAEGEPKVADFGLAHWLDSDSSLTKTGSPIGTPMYMAPEQVRGGGQISPATDIYALGAILFEMLAGRPPHSGESSAEIFYRIVHEEPSSPRKFGSRVARDLETICLKALEKEPERRYPSAASFADDLKRFLAGEPILARPPGLVARAWKWSRRHPVVIAAVLVAALAVGLTRETSNAIRRTKVASLLAAGRSARDGVARMAVELRSLEERCGDLERSTDPSDPDKRDLWDVQRRIGETRRAAADARAVMIASHVQALGLDPSCAEARQFLSDHYWGEFLRAEETADWTKAAECRQYVELYDAGPGTTARISMPGRLSLATPRAPAEVFLFRHELSADLRRVPMPWPSGSDATPIGTTPLRAFPLPAGSYLAVLKSKGYRDVRYPVLIERGREHDGRVTLHTDDEIGLDFLHVPAGPFIRGGDAEAIESHPRETVSVDDFFIGRFEVTTEEYAAFIFDRSWHDEETAWSRTPRAPVGSTSSGEDVWIRDPSTGAIRPTGSPRHPVSGISWENADEYCRWRTERARRDGGEAGYRLPGELEWEKAARGVDGRCFPWGDHFDWSFTMGTRSVDAATVRTSRGWILQPAGSFAKDESPYGVRDLGGSMTEWCRDWFDEARNLRHQRGGGWRSNHPAGYRSAAVKWADPRAAVGGYGFRVVRTMNRSH